MNNISLSVINYLDEFEDGITLLLSLVIEDKLYETAVKKNIDQAHPLFNKSIVLTGTRDNAVIDFLKNVGAKQSSSVSKNTFLVIAKNKDEDTGKAEEARKINVPIMSVEEFIQTYSVN